MDAEDSGLKIKEKQAHGYACFRMVEDATRTQTVYAACFAVVIIIVLIITIFVGPESCEIHEEQTSPSRIVFQYMKIQKNASYYHKTVAKKNKNPNCTFTINRC